MGTSSSDKFLNFDLKDALYKACRTERGGEVTYHGPGQRVMYPILNLQTHKMDLHWYLRALEEAVIRVLDKTFLIEASRLEGLIGVWVTRNWQQLGLGNSVDNISWPGTECHHRFNRFEQIVPCGIRDRQVKSIKELLAESQLIVECGGANGRYLNDCKLIDIAHESLIKEFSEIFQVRIHQKTLSESDIEKETLR